MLNKNEEYPLWDFSAFGLTNEPKFEPDILLFTILLLKYFTVNLYAQYLRKMSLPPQILSMLHINESIKEMNWGRIWISDTRKKEMTLYCYTLYWNPFSTL